MNKRSLDEKEGEGAHARADAVFLLKYGSLSIETIVGVSVR